MKRTVPTWLALTLLMLLVVASATIYFIFQNRQELIDDRSTLQGDVTELEGTVSDLEIAATAQGADLTETDAQRAQAETALAALELLATREASEAESVAAEATRLQESLNSAEATLAAQPTPVAFPLVAFNAPLTDTEYALGVPISITVSATDPAGIKMVNLVFDGNPDNRVEFAREDERLVVVSYQWTAETSGEHTIEASAINASDVASESVIVTFNVYDAEAQRAADDLLRAEIEAAVIAIRELEPLALIEPTFIDSDELRIRLETDIAEDYSPEEARNDAIVLSAFNFMDRDFDLYTALIDLYSDSVAGYYDPETEEFVVVSDDPEFDIAEQVTHAHEFVHALQDQQFDLERINDEELNSDAAFAFRALAEGDATLVQAFYLQTLTPSETLAYFAEADDVNTDSANAVPEVILNDLAFPYIEGSLFAQALYVDDGFAAIDAAYAAPPVSTEHILHPERYLAGELPLQVSLPPLTATLGVGWNLLEEDVFGEFYLRQYLSQQLDDEATDGAATGWGGDRYAVYWNEETQQLVMALLVEWDSAEDSTEFAAAYESYGTAMTGSEPELQENGALCWQAVDAICLQTTGQRTIIVVAPDAEINLLLLDVVAAADEAP